MSVVFELEALLSLNRQGFDSDLNDAESKMSALGSGLSTIAKVGAAAVGAATGAVVAFGKSSIDAGMDFDSAMAQVAATSGKSVDEISDLRDFAQEMGSKTAFSATEAAEALNYMALAGYDAETSMQMLPNVLDLAAAGSINLASASDMITDAQSALGLSLDETKDMVDQMAAASSKSNTSVSQLGEAFLTIGATARNVKGGTAELSTVLGVLADNGIKGSEGGTHLRNMLLSLQNPTDKGAAALKELGVSVYDTDGNMRSMIDIISDMQKGLGSMDQQSRDTMLNGIFNKTDLAAVNALLGTSSERFVELGKEIKNSSYSIEEISKNLLDSGVDFSKYADQYWESAVGIEEGVADLAKQITFNLHDQGLSVAETAEFIANEYGMSMEDATAAVESVKKSLEEAKGAAENMASTQLDNLAGDITLFQSALEGARIAVSDQLTPTLREFVQLGTSGLSEVTQAFKEGGLEGAMTALGDWLSQALDKLIEMLPKVVDAGAKLLTALIKGISDNIPKIIDAALQIITSLANAIMQNLPTIIQAGVQAILQFQKGLADTIPKLMPTVIDMVMSIIDTLVNNLPLLVESGINLSLAIITGMIEALPKIIERLPDIIVAIVNTLIAAIPKIAEAGFKLFVALVQNLPAIIKGILVAVTQIVSGILNAFMGYVNEFVKVGMNLIMSIGRGFANAVGSVIESAKGVVSNIVGAVKGFFGIASPSKVFMEIGDFLMKGLSEGILDGLSGVKDAMDDVNDALAIDDGSVFGDDFVTTTTTVRDTEPPTDSLIPTQTEADRNIVVILELDGVEVGRTVAPYINRESRRVGVQLAGGMA